MTTESPLTEQARDSIRRVPWRSVAFGAVGASTLGLLAAAGLLPLVAGLAGKKLAEETAVAWLSDLGGNALAGWVGDLVLWATGKPLTGDTPADPTALQRDLATTIDALLARDAGTAAALAQLLQRIDAVPLSIAALHAEVGAQGDLLLEQHALLTQISADLTRLGLSGGALGPPLVAETNRVIAAIEARADGTDARLDAALTELRALRATQRQALIAFGQQNQFRDVAIGDVAGGDMHKPTLAPGAIYAPGGTVVQPFTPGPTTATPDEIAAAQARLAVLPTEVVPAPQDALPLGSRMALRRNHQFVGREADLRALAALLKGGETVTVHQAPSTVVSGLGGIGKTQLASEFAYRYGPYFAGVFWLNAAQGDTVVIEIAGCGGAGHLQLFTEAAGLKLAEQVNLVRARWACGLPYLLIFDNCEDPELVRAHHPGGACRVLLTSRTPDWPGDLGVRRHRLGVLPRAESIALLRQHRPDLSDADADALAHELGDLPLALHLAGRFLARYAQVLTVDRYLAELRSPRLFERLPLRAQDGALPTGQSRDVARTFALSYERLDPQNTEDALALRLLIRAAYLVPGEVIPTDLLLATLEADADDLDAQLTATAALERLVALGLLEHEGADSLRMHRLVGAYVRQVAPDAPAQAAVERVVLRVAQQLIAAQTTAPITAFVPILHGVTDAALPRADAEVATLCIWIGRLLDQLGFYGRAQPYLEHSLALRERVLGAEHPATATSLGDLAKLLQSQGNYAAARPLYERALTIRERVLGAEHPATATSLNNLAGLLQSQENYVAARPLYERALTICERVLGAEHPATATSLNNLAGLFRDQGNYAAARPLYERALTIRERVLGAEHPNTATSLSNLAGLLKSQGHYEDACPLYKRALAISEQVLGAEHPNTVTSLSNLASLYQDQGNYAASRPLYERALTIRERVLGAEHSATATSLGNLAGLLQSQGHYEAARPLFERALAIIEQVLGAEHPDTATSLNNLAALYHAQGNYDMARPLYERTLAINEHVLGDEHPATATSLNNLAELFRNQGNYAAALPLYERALTLRERVLGVEHPATATSLNNLAGLFRDQGNYAAARPLYERALAIHEQVLGAEHSATATTLNNLAGLYAELGDFATAIPLAERALTIRRHVLGAAHPATMRLEQGMMRMRQEAGQQISLPNDHTEAFATLIASIARIAGGDNSDRTVVEQSLTHLEEDGWMLCGPVERIWAGERDRAALIEGLDAQDSALIARVLKQIEDDRRPLTRFWSRLVGWIRGNI